MLLELKNVEAAYGNIKALKGINLSVPEGKIVTLIGANGAGKSTTMKTIMGIMKPIAGDVLFKGESIAGMKTHNIVKKGVVLVPEGRQILQNMSVRENLEMGAYQRKDPEGIKEDLSKVFERFPRLFERQNQFGGTLSGGEQQMLAIGRAVMAKPEDGYYCSSCRTECAQSPADCRLCLRYGNGQNRHGRTGAGSCQ